MLGGEEVAEERQSVVVVPVVIAIAVAVVVAVPVVPVAFPLRGDRDGRGDEEERERDGKEGPTPRHALTGPVRRRPVWGTRVEELMTEGPHPPGMAVLVARPESEKPLRDLLKAAGYVLEERPHARFMARGPGATVTFYKTGKVLVTGKSDKTVAKKLLDVDGVETLAPRAASIGSDGGAVTFVARVGTDESGKGDYFGPLVAGAVLIDDPSVEKHLVAEGVRDSKALTSAEIVRLDALVKRHALHSVVAIGPDAYNRMYNEMRNLNVLLAWAHARALENVLEQKHCGRAITDQFGDRKYVENALLAKGKAIRLEQRPRAEADPAVAAASVLARAEFVRRLDVLSDEWGMRLPKGAGTDVLQAARTFVRRHGKDDLGKVAKLHFRTTLAL